jgi:hypothetical protein
MKLMYVVLIVLSTSLTLRADPPTDPVKRYSMSIITDSQGMGIPMILDTQTGRCWRLKMDSKNNVVMVPVAYININNELSLVPTDTTVYVSLASQQTSTQISQMATPQIIGLPTPNP